eukprot:740496-Prymnesium_polylepis.1
MQQSRGSPTQHADGIPPAAAQAELVSGIIYNLLVARDPRLRDPPGPRRNAAECRCRAVPAEIAAAFAHWRHYAAAHRRLQALSRSIHSRRSSSEPKVITATTWAE